MKLVAASLSITLIVCLPGVSRAATDEDAQKIIRQHLHQLLPADQIGGIAVAIRMDEQLVGLYRDDPQQESRHCHSAQSRGPGCRKGRSPDHGEDRRPDMG
jgi:hypothetical protein